MNALPEWMTIKDTSPINERFYFRCHDCLMTICIENTPELGLNNRLSNIRNELKCGVCGGRLDFMGQVEGNRWVHKSEKCTCNEMCQDARGPKCTCSCGGENHGKGYRYYTYTDAAGKINIKPDQDTEKLLAIANEYRAAEQAALNRIHALPRYSDYCNHIWMDRGDWNRIHNAIILLNVARKGVMHKSRIAKLEKVAR